MTTCQSGSDIVPWSPDKRGFGWVLSHVDAREKSTLGGPTSILPMSAPQSNFCLPIQLYSLLTLSTGGYSRCSKRATVPGPPCFDQVEANHRPVEQEAGSMAWYGSHWQPLTGSQTVGTCATLADSSHLNRVAELEWARVLPTEIKSYKLGEVLDIELCVCLSYQAETTNTKNIQVTFKFSSFFPS